MTKKANISALGLKLSVLLALLFFSTIPNLYFSSVVNERQSYRSEAVHSVVSGWAARHKFGRVQLKVPYSYEMLANDKKTRENFDGSTDFDPTNVKIAIKDTIEVRHRGIFDVPIYKADLKMTGEFLIPLDISASDKGETVIENKQELLILTQDTAAISDFTFTVNGEAHKLKRTSEGLLLRLTGKTFKPGDKLAFELNAKLLGYEGMDIAAKADELEVTMDSQWPHPSFKGQLPIDQDITKEGFHARWKLIQAIASQQVTVDYIEPVNIYSQTSRAAKYGFLITLLVLSVLFLMENLSGLSVHPMQYLFMILPLSVYYVLLLACAEHIGFNAAYAIASFSVIALVYVYFRGIGAARMQAGTLGGTLTLVYALILTMLASEDYALLIGAIFLFVAMASFMLLTRKINWSKGLAVNQVAANG